MTLKICAICSREYTDPNLRECEVDGGRLLSVNSGQHFVGMVLDGRYEIGAFLSRGGMGSVFRARQRMIDREVAIKTLPSELISSAEALKRFVQEAKLLSRLSHPNVVTIYDFGHTDDGIPYLAMELLEGHTLKAYLDQSGPLPLEKSLDILLQLCSGLAEAHRLEIVHRDLKPSNIMLIDKPGQPTLVKILDFGVAKLLGDDQQRMTRSGHMVGTPLYMSPEQLTASQVDHRSDIYSLGLIAYEMFSGNVAVEGNNTREVMSNQLQMPIPRFTAPGVDPQLNEALNAVVQRCTAKHKIERFAHATDLRQHLNALRRAVGGAPLSGEFILDDTEEEVTGTGLRARPTIPVRKDTAPVAIASPPSTGSRRRRNVARVSLTAMTLLLAVVAASLLVVLLSSSLSPQIAAQHYLDGLAPALAPLSRRNGHGEVRIGRSPRDHGTLTTPRMVTLTVTSRPRGAEVFLGDTLLGRTPLARQLPATASPSQLRIVSRGYRPHTVKQLIMNRDRAVSITLRKRPGAGIVVF